MSVLCRALCAVLVVCVIAVAYVTRGSWASGWRDAPIQKSPGSAAQILDAAELPRNISPTLRAFLAHKIEERTTRIEKCVCDDTEGMVARSKMVMMLYKSISCESISALLRDGTALFRDTQIATYRMVYEGYNCDFRITASKAAVNATLDTIEYVDCRRVDEASEPGNHYNYTPLKGKVETAPWRVDMSFVDGTGKTQYEVAGIDKDGYLQSVVQVKPGGDACTMLFSPEGVVADTICLANTK